MLHEIETGHFEICRQLCEPLAFELITRAVIDGSSPGSIYVDDLSTPRGAFMTSAEGCFIVGAPDHVVFWDGFKAMINNWADRNEVKPDNDAALYLVAHPSGWNKRLADLLTGRPPITVQRRHYICQELSYDWRTALPEGFVVQQITPALMATLEMPPHIPNWMQSNWGSEGAFFERGGFGFCVVTGQQVVSWCLADCVSGVRCEIGIHTAPGFRQRGLATITTAATVEHALNQGLMEIGWHCNDDNTASWKTAEKVGFVLAREYLQFFWVVNRARHQVELKRIGQIPSR
jgi:RimJ/RimL family protein N-acetyltransferase